VRFSRPSAHIKLGIVDLELIAAHEDAMLWDKDDGFGHVTFIEVA